MLLKLPILILFLTPYVSCDVDTAVIYENEVIHHFLFIFGSLLVGAIVRHAVLSSDITIPYGIVLTGIGIALGIGSLYSDHMFHAMGGLQYMAINYLQEVYLPVIIFSVAFTLDVHMFMKSLWQILVLSIPVSLLVAFTTGQLMRQMVDTTWSNSDAVIFGLMQIPIYPGSVVRWLQGNTVHTKYLLILIEGERLVSSVVGVYSVKLLVYYTEGWVAEWYQPIFGIMRWICLGLPLGYFFGLVSTFLMKFAYNEVRGLMLLTVSTCYMSYYTGQFLLNSGIITCTVTALFMGRERPALFKEVEEALVSYWLMLRNLLHVAYLMLIGVIIPRALIYGQFTIHMYCVVFVTYLMTNILRFFFSMLFFPLLGRLGYGISFNGMVVCVWAGIKSPLCINLAYHFLESRKVSETSQLFFLHTSVLYILMLLINSSFMPVLFKALGLYDISASKQMTMSNCMKNIYETRSRLVAILKMDRLLSDANWPLVMSCTALRHPYRKMNRREGGKQEDESEEDDDYSMHRYTFCPQCEKQVLNEPTMKEMNEMIREAKLRLLKHKKTAYSRQYENGMMSKEGARILHQAVELAMDDENLVIEVDGLLKMFSAENKCLKCFQNCMESILSIREEIIKMPLKKLNKWCYKTINSTLYVMFIYTINVLDVLMLNLALWVKDTTFQFALFFIFSAIFVVYCSDFYIKLMAFSYTRFWGDGVRTYFRSIWRILDFVIMISYMIMSILHIYSTFVSHLPAHIYYVDAAVAVLLLIRIFRVLYFLEVYKYCRRLGNRLSRRLAIETDRNKALAYELGKNYIAGEDDVLENLPQIVEHEIIREKLREVTEQDRLAVTKRLGISEMEMPWITSVVKTKTAIQSVLKGIKDDIYELKVAGWVDDVECHKLLDSLAEKYKEVYSVRYVEPSPPKMILKELIYMNDDAELIEFFFANVGTRKYDPENVVIREGEVAKGVFILITGLFKVTYVPNPVTVRKMKQGGAIPVLDHVCVTSYESPITEYITPGNSFGELSTIMDKPYEGTVTAVTYSEVFFLKRSVMIQGLVMDPDPVAGLKCRIWKTIAFRRAVIILLGVAPYHSYTKEKIKLVVEKAFIPDLVNYKVLVVNDKMQDLILIEGIVVDFNTHDIYVGPCYIPRVVQKLHLSSSRLLKMVDNVQAKIMIIPAKNFSEYEVMMAEEAVGVLVSSSDTKCLRHYIEQRKRSSTDSGSTRSKKLRMFGTRVRKATVNPTGEDPSKTKIVFVNSSPPDNSTLSSANTGFTSPVVGSNKSKRKKRNA